MLNPTNCRACGVRLEFSPGLNAYTAVDVQQALCGETTNSVHVPDLDLAKFDEREQIALEFYDDGIPSANPDSRMRHLTETHRWGQHGDTPRSGCPVCRRGMAKEHERGAIVLDGEVTTRG